MLNQPFKPKEFSVALQDLKYDLCDMYASLCFEESMKNFILQKKCDCPLDCDSITYSYSLVSSRLKEDELCTANQNSPTPLMTDFYERPFPKLFIRQIEKYAKNISADPYEICSKYLKYKAVVTFQLATNDVSVTITSRRLSFFDKLSGFGKKMYNIYPSILEIAL